MLAKAETMATDTLSEEIVALMKRFLSCYRRLSGGKTRVTFFAGIALIAISFLVYPAYPLIFLLAPSSGIVKLGMTVTAWLLSWSLFSAGFLLARSQGYESVKSASVVCLIQSCGRSIGHSLRKR
jgi:hypothetical protein